MAIDTTTRAFFSTPAFLTSTVGELDIFAAPMLDIEDMPTIELTAIPMRKSDTSEFERRRIMAPATVDYLTGFERSNVNRIMNIETDEGILSDEEALAEMIWASGGIDIAR